MTLSKNKVNIRISASNDYPKIAEVHNSMFPDKPIKPGLFNEQDKRRSPKCKHSLWVAECEDRIMAYAYYTQYISSYDPRRFNIWGTVRPEYQSNGVGTLLYGTVIGGLTSFMPVSLLTHSRQNHTTAVDMLRRRGFKEYMRRRESSLDVRSFDFTPYSRLEKSLRKQNIEIRTLQELEGDSERDKKLHDLDWEITRDEPGSENDTRVDFEIFVRDGINAPERLPNGYFVAMCGSEYIGLCILNCNSVDNTVKHGITGVIRKYRRRGIALAMKVRAIEYAKSLGYSIIKTDTEVNNIAILSLNDRLGFIGHPEEIYFEKTIRY